MSKMSQKEGVFNAVTNVYNELKKTIEGVVTLTKEERAEVIEIVTVGIHEGEIEFSDEAKAKYTTFDDIKKKYVPGLVNNWLRKDTRLNGGTKYEAKNPGSRAGSQDDVMKNLKALRTQLVTLGESGDALQAVDQEISKRKAELAKAKVKQAVIDINKIPEDLRHLIPGYEG
jgi:hypothetical protein